MNFNNILIPVEYIKVPDTGSKIETRRAKTSRHSLSSEEKRGAPRRRRSDHYHHHEDIHVDVAVVHQQQQAVHVGDSLSATSVAVVGAVVVPTAASVSTHAPSWWH
jgi:hypothetical protein